MGFFGKDDAGRRRRKIDIDLSFVILIVVGLIVAGVTLPVANSPDSAALCFAPLFTLVLFYFIGQYLGRWMK